MKQLEKLLEADRKELINIAREIDNYYNKKDLFAFQDQIPIDFEEKTSYGTGIVTADTWICYHLEFHKEFIRLQELKSENEKLLAQLYESLIEVHWLRAEVFNDNIDLNGFFYS